MPVYRSRYLREERLNPKTGDILELFDTSQSQSTWGRGERWLVRCVAHDTTVRLRLLGEARKTLAHPGSFCPDCAALIAAGDALWADNGFADLPPDQRGARITAAAEQALGRPLRD
jgi:hypothetical protein